jgi:hypothetical protein
MKEADKREIERRKRKDGEKKDRLELRRVGKKGSGSGDGTHGDRDDVGA